MHLERARLRYLSAIGLALPALAACRDPAPPITATVDEGGAGATSVRTPESSSGNAPPPASDSAGPRLPDPRLSLPTCPTGKFCVPEPSRVDGKSAAPAPHAKCAAVTDHPEDKPDAGFRMHRSVVFDPDGTKSARVKDATACCYTWVIPCPGGRAFRDDRGDAVVAGSSRRRDWAPPFAFEAGALDAAARAALAEHWTREALYEHASIASFAQLTLDLLAFGAPPALVASAQRAGLDEVEHAKSAFALAAAYGGEPVGPTALAVTPCAAMSLAHLARTTFIDACVGESVASAYLADRARTASDVELRALFATMAEDEERHAELAWRIVAWALAEGGAEVAAALRESADEVARELAELDALDEAGESTSATIIRAAVLREIALPCASALLEKPPRSTREAEATSATTAAS